nr:serine protease inhibitor [Pinctada imbricata]
MGVSILYLDIYVMMSVVCYFTFILGAFLFLCDHGIAQSPLSILPVPPPFPDRGPCSDRPAVVGPCRARLRRYTYRNGRCEEFYYGGCLGNRNNFRSRRECQRQCGGGGGGGGDICQLPHAQPGPCLAYMPRYTFNSNTGRCEEFIYGGCQGNANRFETLQECRRRCGGGGPPRDRCFERPKVQGPCEAAIPSFSYNPRTRRCEEFTYGGCGGTRNRFSTLRECRDRCQRGGGGGGGVDICELPPRASGLCLAYIPSYSYDSARGECVRFIYGGCGGNENRFGSLQECQRRCGGGGGGGGGDGDVNDLSMVDVWEQTIGFLLEENVKEDVETAVDQEDAYCPERLVHVELPFQDTTLIENLDVVRDSYTEVVKETKITLDQQMSVDVCVEGDEGKNVFV